jgi:hypothetical protein
MKVGKIVSLILILSLLASALFSCAKSPEKLTEKADAILEKKAHVIDVDIDYTVENATLSEMFSQLGTKEVKLFVDGDKLAIESSMSIDLGSGKNAFNNTYVIAGGVVYMDMMYTTPSISNSTKGKSPISDEQAALLKQKASIIGDIGIEDFESAEFKKLDGDKVIICNGVCDEVKARLESIMISELSGTAEKVGAKDVRLTIELDGKRYDTVTLVCEYEITMSGFSYTVRAEYELEYDYDERVNITAPNNLSEYSDIELDNILGTP